MSSGYQTKHGYFSREDLGEVGAKLMTNWEGRRVIVFPLYHIDGFPYYPPIDVPPGEERRKREAAMMATYHTHRKRQKGKQKHGEPTTPPQRDLFDSRRGTDRD